MAVIELNNLSKTYIRHKKTPGLLGAFRSLIAREFEEIPAVSNLSFTVGEGEFVGLLGPNGAGKTTTLKMLSGILYPTGGETRVLGFTPWERNPAFQRQFAIVMGQKNQLDWDLPPMDSYLVLKEIYDIPEEAFRRRVGELSDLLNVKHLLTTQVRRLSLGERMKAELIGALLHGPRVLFLDEPTIGMDVVSQAALWDFLKDLNAQEKITIILTSHYMEDIQRLCERVIIIDTGKKIYDGKLADLLTRFGARKEIRVSFSKVIEERELKKYGTIVSFENLTATLTVPVKDVSKKAEAILSKLPVTDVSISTPEAREVIRAVFEGKNQLQ